MLNEFLNVKSITRDNGQENRKHKYTSISSFFCDPYSAWQKPHVENIIKTLRKFFKKGSDLDNYSESEIEFAAFLMNNKPRKCLGYKTPFELMVQCGMLDLNYYYKNKTQKNNRFVNDFDRRLVAIEG